MGEAYAYSSAQGFGNGSRCVVLRPAFNQKIEPFHQLRSGVEKRRADEFAKFANFGGCKDREGFPKERFFHVMDLLSGKFLD